MQYAAIIAWGCALLSHLDALLLGHAVIHDVLAPIRGKLLILPTLCGVGIWSAQIC